MVIAPQAHLRGAFVSGGPRNPLSEGTSFRRIAMFRGEMKGHRSHTGIIYSFLKSICDLARHPGAVFGTSSQTPLR